MSDKKVVKMVFAAVFAAIVCVVTMMIRVPSLGPNGYVNIGDSIVLLSAWVIGGPYGGLAAGIGSGLADLLAGYGAYVPGTTIIKFTMAIAAWAIYRLGTGKKEKSDSKKIATYVVSAVVAETIMVAGYFVYEFIILRYGAGAGAAVISNIFQGGANVIISIVIVTALEKVHVTSIVKRLLV
ncbi:MAG TPA: ECF transporter S component [Eubacterium sp.]|nr:ECF transporter S component [Eubacterium sp.]